MYRKSTLLDVDGIHELICLLVGHDLDKTTFASLYEKQVQDPNHYCLVDDRNGVLYGVMNMRFEGQLHHGGMTAEIIEFFVREEARGKGSGREMLEIGKELARKRGCVLIEVTSKIKRVDAHRFYVREKLEHTHFKFVNEF